MGVTYPPEPWRLYGHAHVGAWWIRSDDAPPPDHPGTRQIRIFGRVLVLVAFFRYDEPSPLTYDEVMATQLVRDGWRPRVSITHIWVDSPASRDGGRELWAIPKELAEFHRETHLRYSAVGIAELAIAIGRTLPFKVPVAFKTAQRRDESGRLVTTPVRGRVRLATARGQWSFTSDGPLAFLSGYRPFATLSVSRFSLVFGRRN